ncbi:hypothetical protein [Marinobacter segnicrescens]|uniref:hypothetical protein n=1 Tax=Marinobacter segnicrescens TaxID=430453 RepID=UPI003A8D4D5C
MAERYEALSAKHAQALLDDYGLSVRVLRAFAERLKSTLDLDFYKGEFSCNATPFEPPRLDDSAAAMRQRVTLLADVGPALFWAAQELESYVELLQTPGQVAAEYRDATCKRVEQLRAALACFANNPAACSRRTLIEDIFARYYQVPGHVGDKLHIANNRLARFKATLNEVEKQLFQALGDPDSPLRDLLLTADLSDEVALREVMAELQAQSLQALQLQAVELVYRTWRQLPAAVTDAINSDPKLAALADRAEEAWRAINDQSAELKDKVGWVRHADDPLHEQRRTLRAFVDVSIAQARDIERLENQIESLPEEAKRQLQREIKETVDDNIQSVATLACDQLGLEQDSESDWGSLSWGAAPGDNTLGYRFTAHPTGQTLFILGRERALYRLSAELLVRIPDVTYTPSDDFSDAGCGKTDVPAYRAFDLGLQVDGLYALSGEEVETAARFALYRDPLVNTVRTNLEDLQAALEGLGVPADWLQVRAQWSVTPDLNDLSLRLPIQGAPMDVPIIRAGQVVLDPAELADNLCRNVVARRVPEQIRLWANDFDLGVGGWRLAVSPAANANLNDNVCDFVAARASGPDAEPSINSSLAVETGVVLSGNLDSTAFQWPAQAYLTATPNGIRMKSLVFGDTPAGVQSFIERRLESVKQSWSFDGREDLTVSLSIDKPSITAQPAALRVPLALDVGSKGCVPGTITGRVSIPGGEFAMSGGSLEDLVEARASCAAERELREWVNDKLSCDQFDDALFGWPVLPSAVQSEAQDNGECLISASFEVAGEAVQIRDIRLVPVDGAVHRVDLSEAKPSSNMVNRLRAAVKKQLGKVADSGVEVTKVRFVRDALTMHVAVNAEEPIGRIDFGIVTLSVDGRINFDTEFSYIVANKLSDVLEPRLQALALRTLPPRIEDFDIDLSYVTGAVEAVATFKVRVRDDLPSIPGTLRLLPTLQLKPDITVQTALESAMAKYLGKALPVQFPPVTIDALVPEIGPDFDVTLMTGVTIDLDELGSMAVRPIYITRNGVRIAGRVELRLGVAFPVYAPPPLYITDPGLFYDFRSKQVGVIGSLTLLDPGVDRLYKIEGTLAAGGDEFDQSSGLRKLVLTGETIMSETLPIAYTRGELNFEPIEVLYTAGTSPLFQKVFQSRMRGDIKLANAPTASFATEMMIFGARIFNGDVIIHIASCPIHCLSTKAVFNLPIGEGSVEAQFGPLIYDARLNLVIDLELGGRSIGTGASLEAEILKARLEAELLEIFRVTLQTPGLEQMTPEYLSKVLASLLQVDLKDILKFLENLENLEIKLAPVGSPGGDDGTADTSGNGDSTGDGPGAADGRANNGSGGGPAANGGAPGLVGSTVDPNSQPEGEPMDFKFKIGPQRTTRAGNHIRACNPQGNQWGTLYRWGSNNWGFWGEIYGLSDRVYTEVCRPFDNGRGPWSGQSNTSEVIAIRDNFAPLRTFTRFRGYVGEYDCSTSDTDEELCRTRDMTYTFEYEEQQDDSDRRPRAINVWPYRYKQETIRSTEEKKVILPLTKARLERFEEYGGNHSFRVRQEIKSELLEQEGVKADRIHSYTRVSEGFPFFTSPKIEVNYEISSGGELVKNSDKVNVWVNGDGAVVLFDHRCVGDGEHLAGCRPVNSGDKDTAFRQILVDNDIPLADVVPELDPTETAWLVGEAIPGFINGRDIAPRGETLGHDEAVGGCKVSAIYQFDSQYDRRFRVFKERDAGSDADRKAYFTTDFTVSKVGPHAGWADSDDTEWIITIVSYLACIDQPMRWLRDNTPWLEPDIQPGAVPKFYYQADAVSAEPYAEVTVIEKQQAPASFLVMKENEYARIVNNRFETWTERARKQLLEEMGSPENKEISVKVNATENTETVVVHDSARERVLLRVRPANLGSSENKYLPAKTRTRVEYELDAALLKSCIRELMQKETASPRDPTGIISYLSLASPSVETGVGPVQLVRSLQARGNNGETVSCQPGL